MQTLITIEQAQIICNRLSNRFGHRWFIVIRDDDFAIECELFDNFPAAKVYTEGFYDAIREV